MFVQFDQTQVAWASSIRPHCSYRSHNGSCFISESFFLLQAWFILDSPYQRSGSIGNIPWSCGSSERQPSVLPRRTSSSIHTASPRRCSLWLTRLCCRLESERTAPHISSLVRHRRRRRVHMQLTHDLHLSSVLAAICTYPPPPPTPSRFCKFSFLLYIQQRLPKY